MARRKPSIHHCAMCSEIFTSKIDYNQHTLNHEDSIPVMLVCQICNWPFNDSLALENHKISTGHGSPRYSCENCGKNFASLRGKDDHMRPPGCSKVHAAASAGQSPFSLRPLALSHSPAHHNLPAQPASGEWCDRCAKTFKNRNEYDYHRSFKANTACADHNRKTPPKNRVGYVDLDKPENAVGRLLGYHDSFDEAGDAFNSDSDTPTNMSVGAEWCGKCKTTFASMAQYNAHVLRCRTNNNTMTAPVAPHGSTPSAASKLSNSIHAQLSPVKQQQRQHPVRSPPAIVSTAKHSASPPALSVGTFACDSLGCQKICRSEAGLKVHREDTHGIGARPLDLAGRDSRKLPQRAREQLGQQGFLRPPPSGPSRGVGSRRRRRAPPVAQLPVRLATGPRVQAAESNYSTQPIPAFGVPLQASLRPGVAAPLLTSLNIGGAYEMEQAKHIQGKILPLLIQSDIFINHDGKMTVCDINWTRISVQKQPEVAGMFDAMCHLPKALQQGEYLPAPKTFASEYQVEYPVSEFMASPSHDRSRSGIGVVVIACSKIVLENGRQEVVKVAAVNLITCRILMNHLVCTDPKALVANWRSNETGLFSWSDMEQARKIGFKVFKGWSAVRKALFKFIDAETIIVGHNLRSDLDCLRIEHGRAVDIIKVAEKAAKGPLSKAQLALDSMLRNYPQVHLRTDPKFGRDVLMNAFAIREMGLWVNKHREKFEKDIRQKSRDYELIMPRSTGGA